MPLDVVVEYIIGVLCRKETEELLHNWPRVLEALKLNPRLTAYNQAIINTKSFTILSWVWSPRDPEGQPSQNFLGVTSGEKLFHTQSRVLEVLKLNPRPTASKTTINTKSFSILGWVWSTRDPKVQPSQNLGLFWGSPRRSCFTPGPMSWRSSNLTPGWLLQRQ